MSVGEESACAIVSGAAKCWGGNEYGELGNGTHGAPGGTNAVSDVPVQVQGLTSGVTAISVGLASACAVVNGAAECWGYNYYGVLGNGDRAGPEMCEPVRFGTCSTTPIQVKGLTSGVTAISVGEVSACAVVSGTVECWGDNPSGELGDGGTASSYVPVPVLGLLPGKVTAISVGAESACAAFVSGAAECWGDNGGGELGNGTTTSSDVPIAVHGLTSGVTAISVGAFSACAGVSGAAECWGENDAGQLGDGTTVGPEACAAHVCSTTPVQVQGLTSGVTAISDGSCAVVFGAADCWGDDTGNATTTSSDVPVQVQGLTSGVTAIGNGDGTTCAVVSGGAVECWGDNSFGQLGDGTTTGPETCGVAPLTHPCSTTPVEVQGLTG